MATFTDTIRFVVEAVTGNAERNLKGVRGELTQAEGATGRFREGVGRIGGVLRDNLALGVAGAGAAVTAFATKAIGEFQDLALSADKFAAASGLAVEDASRWIEVTGDIGINTETIAGAMNRLNRAAGSGALAELGIDTDNANERLILTLQYLDGIEDETRRATEAQKLLGKSWTELAPLIESSATLRENLAGVSDAKVIDPEEVEKAKRYREAMDTLNESVEALTLAAGEFLVPALTDVAESITLIKDAIDKLPPVPDWLGAWARPAISTAKDLLDALPGGSGDAARNPIDIARDFFGGSGVTSSATRAPAGTPGTGTTINTTVVMPPGTDSREVERAITYYDRYHGTGGWGSSP